ncbi:phage tail protein [Pseudobutyrivibrio sp.]|uniref:phage tail protein n=1 Tax=Pseudobutyrivibrio sp. TaxID=2014367 RepID=UPI0025FDD0B4|nr:phage tail protein [Pseudobutyrivibrio sp.]
MSNVGSLGDINFYCKSVSNRNQILSFHDLSRSSTASFAEHERNGEKSYLEFNADGLDELTMSIEANANFGVKPLEVEGQLYQQKSGGTAENFVLGGKQVGDNPFVITNLTETYKILHTDGRPIAIGFQVTLKEYANQVAAIDTIPPATTIGETQTPKATTSDTYTVVKGDCLWNIAKKYYGKGSQYTKIYNANKSIIKNPNLIYPGQVLTIPK